MRGKRWRWARWLGVFLIVSGLVVYVYQSRVTYQIKQFEYLRDASLISKSFDKDHHWLTDNPKFDVSRVAKDLNPSQYSTFNKGKLKIKVLYDHGKPAGYTAYFKESFSKGKILFLWIDPEYRGKGYGNLLLQYAIDQLFNQGCSNITLITRVSNTWAQKVYTAAGMKEISRDPVYVSFGITR